MYALGTFQRPGERPFPGLVIGEGTSVVDLSGYGWPTTTAVLAAWAGARPVLAAIAGGSRPGIPAAELEVLAPLVPRTILHCGANYRRRELDELITRGRRPSLPGAAGTVQTLEAWMATDPLVYEAVPTPISAPHAPVLIDPDDAAAVWHVELGVVIGRPGQDISESAAPEHVAGYLIAGRAAAGPLRLGPWLVPAEVVSDPHELAISLSVNTRVVSRRCTADMVFDVPALIQRASLHTTLEFGDLLLTGSPLAGGPIDAPPLRDGDLIEATIAQLGSQRGICQATGR